MYALLQYIYLHLLHCMFFLMPYSKMGSRFQNLKEKCGDSNE
jgi:hypothetical protein